MTLFGLGQSDPGLMDSAEILGELASFQQMSDAELAARRVEISRLLDEAQRRGLINIHWITLAGRVRGMKAITADQVIALYNNRLTFSDEDRRRVEELFNSMVSDVMKGQRTAKRVVFTIVFLSVALRLAYLFTRKGRS